MATKRLRFGTVLLFVLVVAMAGPVARGQDSIATPDTGREALTPGLDEEPVGMPGTLTLLVLEVNTGVPVAGASVTVTDDMTGTVIATGLTGPDGVYVSDELPGGTYTVNVSATGYESFSLPVWINGAASDLAWLVPLPAQALLAVVVTDAMTGLPIEGAQVFGYGRSSVVGMTDETGTFNAGSLFVGAYSIDVSAAGYVNGFLAFELSGDQVVSIALQPIQPGVLTVSVVDRYTGMPIADANVAVYDPRAGSNIATGTTGPDGVFVTDEIPGGWYELTASAEGYFSGSTSAQVQGSTSATVALDSRPAGMLTVTVLDGTSGLPIAEALVVVRNPDGSEAASGMTDADGRIVTGAIGEGYFYVDVSAEGYITPDPLFVWVSGDTSWSVTVFPKVPGLLTIRVVNQANGGPVDGAEVVVRDPYTYVEVAAGTSDAAGVFITPELPGGMYAVIVGIDGYYSYSASVLVSGPTTHTANLEAIPGGPLTIEAVTWSDGQLLPVESASVVVRDYHTGVEVAFGVTDAQGRLVIEDVPGGSYSFDVSATGYMDASGAVMVNGGGWASIELFRNPELPLSLSTETGVPGSLVAVSGSGFLPKEDVTIQWGGTDGQVIESVKAKKDGTITRRVRVPDVPAGQYRIVAIGETSGVVAVAEFLVETDAPVALLPE